MVVCMQGRALLCGGGGQYVWYWARCYTGRYVLGTVKVLVF